MQRIAVIPICVCGYFLMTLGSTNAGDSEFLRIRADHPTRISALDGTGWLSWSNAVMGGTCTIQRATCLTDTNCWTPYTWFAITSRVMRFVACTPRQTPGMVFVPGGIQTGTDPDYGEYVIEANSFLIDRTEVTLVGWYEVATWGLTHGYSDLIESADAKDWNHPVGKVTWHACLKYCNARSEMEGKKAAYYTDVTKREVYRNGVVPISDDCVDWANGYRLPTATEWEYAARGGVPNRRFPWGNEVSHNEANFRNDGGEPYAIGTTGFHPMFSTSGLPYTCPVTNFQANGHTGGLYGMSGNAWEWCWDYYPQAQTTNRMIRGGGFYSPAAYCGVGRQYGFRPSDPVYDVSFRPVLPLPE